MVAEFADQDVREQPWTRRAAIDWPAGRSRLHNAVARGTGFLEPPVTDPPPMPRHVVKLLSGVFTGIAKCAAALWAARIIGLVNNVYARPIRVNGVPFLRISLPRSCPVFGSNASIVPSPKFPTSISLLSDPKLAGACARTACAGASRSTASGARSRAPALSR